jgi:hypothetical protein
MTRPNRIRGFLRIRVKWERIDAHPRPLEKRRRHSTEGGANTLPRMPLAEISFYNVVSSSTSPRWCSRSA